jgi:hypothetical protein
MGMLLQIVHDTTGTWSVHGLPARPVAYLASLPASIDYARRECAEAPATIELVVDGFYAVIHQEQGWPRERLATGIEQPIFGPEDAHTEDPPVSARFGDWLRRWS